MREEDGEVGGTAGGGEGGGMTQSPEGMSCHYVISLAWEGGMRFRLSMHRRWKCSGNFLKSARPA